MQPRPVANIGREGIARRRGIGLMALAVAVAAALALRLAGAPSWAGILLLPVYWAAGIGLFQAREKT
jgi:hypothetical protein